MLAIFRRYLNTWPARLFFLVLVASFGLWGVADVIRNLGAGDGSAATVAGRKIEMPELQDAYRRQLAQVTRMFGTQVQPTPQIRRSVAEQSLAQLVTQAALDAKVDELGLTAPDDAVRAAVFVIPNFHGAGGTFSRPAFEAFLRNAGLTEQRFLSLMRTDLDARQLMEAVRSGSEAPEIETRAVFAFQQEKRVADAVQVPFAAIPPPAAPTEAQLHRWYDNHPDDYRTPELRRIKAVILAPQTVARDIDVSEDEMRADYTQHQSLYQQPERRSVQIVEAPTEALAGTLAGRLSDGTDWDAVRKAAEAAGGSAVELTDATRIEFPSRALADSVFAAAANVVSVPSQDGASWGVVRVTKIAPGLSRSFDQAKDEARARVIASKAADVMDVRANRIEGLLTGGTTLDDLPADIGVAAVAGTLDAQGNTAAGERAPIPGPAELRPAFVQAAFQAKPGDAVHLVQAPNAADGSQSYYAVAVEAITPPATRPYEEVAASAEADWTHDALRHAADEAAAKVLAAVKGGQSLADAAVIAGLAVRRLPPVGRAAPVAGVPAQLIQPLFGMKQGEATMFEDADGFTVAVLAEIQTANADADPVGYGQMREALNRAVGDDTENVFAAAVRDRARPKVNRAAIESLVQAE